MFGNGHEIIRAMALSVFAVQLFLPNSIKVLSFRHNTFSKIPIPIYLFIFRVCDYLDFFFLELVHFSFPIKMVEINK